MSQPISPAIIINERFDLRPQVPTGYNVLVTGFTSEGVANEPFVIQNITDFVALFGEPDPSRPEQIYSYDSAKRIIDSGANLVFVKLPYGAGEGYDVGEEFSALLFPAWVDSAGLGVDPEWMALSAVPFSALSATTLSATSPFDDGLSAGEIFSNEFYAEWTTELSAASLSAYAGFLQEIHLGSEWEVLSAVPTSALSATTLSATYPFFDGLEVGDILTNDLYLDWVVELSAADLSAYTGVMREIPLSSDYPGYAFGEPIRVPLTEEEFDNIQCGQIDWDETFTLDTDLSSYDATKFGKAGLIVLDKGRAKSNDGSEGYYISVTDNSDGDPATDWDAIKGIQTSYTTAGQAAWTNLPAEKYDFALTSEYTATSSSISQSVAALASQRVSTPWESREYNNYLNVTLWRLRKDVQNGLNTLIPVVVESHTGSVSESETVISEGGYNQNVFLGDVVEGGSSRLQVLVNPVIKEAAYESVKGEKVKSVRMWREVDTDRITNPTEGFNFADDLYSISQYVTKQVTASCDVGDIPKKLKSALCTVDNPDRVEIDLSVEAGLGTVWTTVNLDTDSWLQAGNQEAASWCYDDSKYLDVVGDLGRAIPDGSEPGIMREHWRKVFDCFVEFAEQTRVGNGGNMHLHVADPLRQILVNGRDCRVYDSKTKCKNPGVFADKIYWPLKNLSKGINTSVATIDAEWYKANNVYTSGPVWVPSSAVTAALFASTDFPWQAAAGVNRGLVTGVLDIALDPVQRDRDYLWKIHMNSVFYDRFSDGFMRFADQTLLKNDNIQLRQNSARRLMVWLEKNLRVALRPFLFEPNNLNTRVRFKNQIELYLKTLLDNGAIEDFAVSLARNSGTTAADGVLIADIAIKITGLVELIKLNFNLARLDQPFQEVF